MSDQDVLTVEELAQRLRIGRRAAYEAVGRGDVPGVLRIGRSIRISAAAVDRWLGVERKEHETTGQTGEPSAPR